MSERLEDPELEEEWDELDEEELPTRPRSRLLRPLPIALIAVAIAAGGFLGGVEVQKSSGSGGSAGGLPGVTAGGGLPTFAAAAASTPGGTEAAATGTVSGVAGKTIYVKESDGTVVAVKAEDGSTLTRDSNVAAKKIHPGDTVVVEGSKHGSTVKASSIAATESGVEASAAAGGFPAAAAGAGASEAEGEGASVESLFGE